MNQGIEEKLAKIVEGVTRDLFPTAPQGVQENGILNWYLVTPFRDFCSSKESVWAVMQHGFYGVYSDFVDAFYQREREKVIVQSFKMARGDLPELQDWEVLRLLRDDYLASRNLRLDYQAEQAAFTRLTLEIAPTVRINTCLLELSSHARLFGEGQLRVKNYQGYERVISIGSNAWEQVKVKINDGEPSEFPVETYLISPKELAGERLEEVSYS